ncbi:MAG TPA: hypothetical protein VLE43_03030 [Candidatus Saccharimonadia bacterium]|nr:hypothetical protein [Candidatus Saccharimonadia bacterium]
MLELDRQVREQELVPNRQAPVLVLVPSTQVLGARAPNRPELLAMVPERERALGLGPAAGRQEQELNSPLLRVLERSVPVAGGTLAPPASIPREVGKSWGQSWWHLLHQQEGPL